MIVYLPVFLMLFVVGFSDIQTQSEMLSIDEVLQLKNNVQHVLDLYNAKQKELQQKIALSTDTTKIQEQKKLGKFEQVVDQLKRNMQRLNEIDDMPLSRPEAEQIKTNMNQFRQSI